ncbi:TPA: hypothetical protein ACPZ0I_005528, partial [Klebsiella michiganensis]
MTSKLTREQVIALIAEYSYDSALIDALEYLLAAMECEPVYQIEHDDDTWSDVEEEEMLRVRSIGDGTRTLYTAPPTPVSSNAPAVDGGEVYQIWSAGICQWVECDKSRYDAHASFPAQRRVLYTSAPESNIKPVAWLWSRDDERDVSLTPPDDDEDAADAIECGWTA